MSPLLRDDDLVRIEIPADGEWVDVKRRLSRGDEVAVQRSIVGGTTVEMGKTLPPLEAGRYLEAAEFAVLDVAIVAWSFDEPVTSKYIRQLDGASVDAIKERLNELYPGPRKEEDRGNSNGSGPATSEASAVPLPNSVGLQ